MDTIIFVYCMKSTLMKKCLAFLLSLFFAGTGFSQPVPELITKVLAAQRAVSTISYTLLRSDTFVTGTNRIITGRVKMKTSPADSVFGFLFWGTRDGVAQETIYDGRTAFNIDHTKKTYSFSTDPVMIPHYLGNPGGQLIMPDLLRLDTAKATGFELKEDDQHYLLTMYLPDITQYDVISRYKVFTIDKKLLLPLQVRSHQETLGKVQDMDYRIQDISINDPSSAYDFSAERFPADYTSEKRNVNKKLISLKGRPIPVFALTSFTSTPVSTVQFKNKVVLLDFWEVWCGPCIVSMPKVQSLYDRYKSQGLEVYGMMSEKAQLETARLMVEKRKIGFPMLVSNAKVMEDFGVNAVPTYVLIDKKGNISFVSEGFSDQLEEEIKKNLQGL